MKEGDHCGHIDQQIRSYVPLICGEVNIGEDLKEIIWRGGGRFLDKNFKQ